MRLLTSRPRRGTTTIRRRWGVWLCAMGAGLLAALIGFPGAESSLRQLKNAVHAHDPSGQVAVVEIDDRSLAALGRWPIPRGVYARLIDTLFAHGARSVAFNIDLSSASSQREDAKLAAAISRHPMKVTLASHVVPDPRSGNLTVLKPLDTFSKHAKIASGSFRLENDSKIYKLPYAVALGEKSHLELATLVAGRSSRVPPVYGDESRWSRFSKGLIPSSETFFIDGAIRSSKIPHASLITTLENPKSASRFYGKRILIGASSEQAGDMYVAPPYGRIAGVMLQAIGVETLLGRSPIYFGALPGIFIAAIFGFLSLCLANRRRSMAAVMTGCGLTLILQSTTPEHWVFDIIPAMAICVLIAGFNAVAIIDESLRSRAAINQVSGLLNLTALRALLPQTGTRLIVAHIHNFAEATATMPPAGEATLVAQIASRLRLGMTEKELYHGDNGVFAWFSREDVEGVGERLDALHALFRSGVSIEERALDLVVTFGVDDDPGRSIANRLGSALVAATEAHTEGARWRQFDRAKLADTAWKLSMLSELDAAIDDGALWVAYQPKLDLRERRIVGAEALVRWTHPEKGAISPIEFIAAAEQHNRIEKLTAHVLERAVLAAATINAHDIGFGIAVNLSARLLDGAGLVEQVSGVLARHGLDPARLTLEVTETASLTSEHSLDALHELRALGVHISIDDYGTGLSTLEYLRKIPAGEIKIDRSFIQAVLTSSSDLLMVNSTIQLAHSLGHSVVAEGVESADILLRLTELGCDIAQGYHIGRPMTFQDLVRRLLAERRQAA